MFLLPEARLLGEWWPPAHCQIPGGPSGEVCGRFLGDNTLRVDLCARGAVRLRADRALVVVLARVVRREGAAVDAERVCPVLARTGLMVRLRMLASLVLARASC